MNSPLKWQPIPGFPGYEVTREAEVRRVWQNAMGHWFERKLRPTYDDRGRKRFTLCLGGKAKKIRSSRLVLIAFVGPCPPGLECCHDDGDETNDRLENLRWDTHSANLMDRRRHGTAPCGEDINTAKLTENDVREIRRIGYPLRPLAERFGVSEALVSLILKRKVWQHVK